MGRPKQIDDQKLLDIARDIFRRRGPGATAREISVAAGISEAAIFKRFPTKSALYLAAMLPKDVDPDAIIASEIADTREALIETSRRLLGYFREVIPVSLQIAAQPEAGFADIAAHFAPERTKAIASALVEFLRQRARTGAIAPPDILATTQMLIAAIHSLAAFEAIGLHEGSDMSPAIPQFIDQLWHGIGPRRSNERA